MEKKVILFDGECGFCNSTMMHIAKRDVNNKFHFVSNLSRKGRRLLSEFGLEGVEKDTLILFHNDEVFIESYAFKKIACELPNYRWIANIMSLAPWPSNIVYRLIAKIRRQIPVKQTCDLPSDDIRVRFELN